MKSDLYQLEEKIKICILYIYTYNVYIFMIFPHKIFNFSNQRAIFISYPNNDNI